METRHSWASVLDLPEILPFVVTKEVEDTYIRDLFRFADNLSKEFGEKIPAEVKTEIESKISELRKTLSGNDKKGIESAAESLSLAMQKIGQHASQNKTQSGDSEKKTNGENGTRDADFEDGGEKSP